jgi:hypothetical protein
LDFAAASRWQVDLVDADLHRDRLFIAGEPAANAVGAISDAQRRALRRSPPLSPLQDAAAGEFVSGIEKGRRNALRLLRPTDLFDLFGNRDGTVAYTTIDDKDIFGANSNSPTYTATDRHEAEQMRDTLISKYPGSMNTTSISKMPNDALFHAESNVLLRAARENGGTLAGRSLDVFVDSKMCNNCERIVPLVGLELGNPTITIMDTTKVPKTFRDGLRLK